MNPTSTQIRTIFHALRTSVQRPLAADLQKCRNEWLRTCYDEDTDTKYDSIVESVETMMAVNYEAGLLNDSTLQFRRRQT